LQLAERARAEVAACKGGPPEQPEDIGDLPARLARNMLCISNMTEIGQDEPVVAGSPFQERRADWLRGVAVVVGLAGVLSLVGWCQGAEGRSIRALPAPERRALFARTLENLATVCAESPDGMHDYCEGQARLALEFSECEAACQALATGHISRAVPRR
jgi:hypothetical protein